MYLRSVHVPSSSGKIHQYLRIVEAYRQDGKVKQRVIADLGRKDTLAALLPQLQRVLLGPEAAAAQGAAEAPRVLEAATWGPMLVVRELAGRLGLTDLLRGLLPNQSRNEEQEKDAPRVAPPAERALVLIANRLIRPGSEHALAGWLESDWVCDTAGRRFVPQWRRRGRVQVAHRQLDRWYRTLDRLVAVKSELEVALYGRLRDLFSLKVDLVLYDITSTYFEGAGPAELAFHGHSRDGQPQNVQVVVGVVMAGSWPIAHHVFAGNTVDVSTVQEVLADLDRRFAVGRVIFVGDRGMVSRKNLAGIIGQGHGYLVGVKRRSNPQVDGWLLQLRPEAWTDCPGGINTQERSEPFKTRVQEIASGEAGLRVFVIDSEERRAYEQGQRLKCMERTLKKLRNLQKRVAAGKLREAGAIGASAQRALAAHHGHRYYGWRLAEGKFEFFEEEARLAAEKRIEGTYVIATSEPTLTPLEAVAAYKQLQEVERGFRSLKDVLALRPIWHHSPVRVKGHILVAALALLLERVLEKRLRDAGVNLSAREAMLAMQTVRHVRFHVNGKTSGGVAGGSSQARQVLRALGLDQLSPPTPPKGDETVV
jgi:transposase